MKTALVNPIITRIVLTSRNEAGRPDRAAPIRVQTAESWLGRGEIARKGKRPF
jgi:hypothetical protein